MEDPKNDIQDVVRGLVNTPTLMRQAAVLQKYFTEDVKFYHFLINTNGGREDLTAIYQMAEVGLNYQKVEFQNILYDEQANAIALHMTIYVRPWFLLCTLKTLSFFTLLELEDFTIEVDGSSFSPSTVHMYQLIWSWSCRLHLCLWSGSEVCAVHVLQNESPVGPSVYVGLSTGCFSFKLLPHLDVLLSDIESCGNAQTATWIVPYLFDPQGGKRVKKIKVQRDYVERGPLLSMIPIFGSIYASDIIRTFIGEVQAKVFEAIRAVLYLAFPPNLWHGILGMWSGKEAQKFTGTYWISCTWSQVIGNKAV